MPGASALAVLLVVDPRTNASWAQRSAQHMLPPSPLGGEESGCWFQSLEKRVSSGKKNGEISKFISCYLSDV